MKILKIIILFAAAVFFLITSPEKVEASDTTYDFLTGIAVYVRSTSGQAITNATVTVSLGGLRPGGYWCDPVGKISGSHTADYSGNINPSNYAEYLLGNVCCVINSATITVQASGYQSQTQTFSWSQMNLVNDGGFSFGPAFDLSPNTPTNTPTGTPTRTPTPDVNTLTVSVNPSNGGIVTAASQGGGQGINCGSGNSDCTENYSSWVNVALDRSTSSGYTFSNWSGACSGSGGCTVSMSADRSVTANFVAYTPTPTRTSTPTRTPTVTPTRTPTSTRTPTPTRTPTSTPTRTPTPTPVATFSFSGIIFLDENENKIRDAGEGVYSSGASVFAAGADSGSAFSDGSGFYEIDGLIAGSYNVTLSSITDYAITSDNPVSSSLGPDRSIDFGIKQIGICEDGDDNDGDGRTDCEQTSCYPDYNPDLTCDDDREELPPSGECSDNLDNDGDGLIDGQDPDCYDDEGDFDPTLPEIPPPVCSNGLNADPTVINSGETSDLLVGVCTDTGDPDTSYDWDPDSPTDPPACAEATITNILNASSQSESVWTAPSCNLEEISCNPSVTVVGPGGQVTYSESITVRQAGEINVAIRDVTDGSACNDSAPLYTGSEVTLELVKDSSVIATENTDNGTYTFACLQNGDYFVGLDVPLGYRLTGGTNPQGTSITDADKTRDILFCINNLEAWFQTEEGDVRMRGIINPIPGGLLGSTSSEFPGIFHSTRFTAEFEAGGDPSSKNWVVNNEYAYNNLTSNRNGTVAYSFYKSRARQEGIDITEISGDDLNLEINNDGIFEHNGDLTITDYDHIDARRVVLLVSGNVRIETEIEVTPGSLFILAASGNITVAEGIGQPLGSFSLTDTNLEGYYSAEQSIILEGQGCNAGVPDRRLNIGGALIANAKKPFSGDGGGIVDNQRSLCADDDFYPSLYVGSRPDFLTQLTDFYKVSYTKWREVRP